MERQQPGPAYVQLDNSLKKRIADRCLGTNNPLPSESELCAQFKISPMTARRAINILTEQGIVIAERGRGTFVKQPTFETTAFHPRGMQTLLGDPLLTNVSLLRVNVNAVDDIHSPRSLKSAFGDGMKPSC
jgi:DNA-binding GntR family transcriptional regulator